MHTPSLWRENPDVPGERWFFSVWYLTLAAFDFALALWKGRRLRLAVVLAVLAGLAVATQTSFTSAAQRMIGPVMVAAVSGFTTGLVAFTISLFTNRAELTSRAFGYSLASGVLGAFIVGAIVFSAGQGGVARALSVVASQLLFGLLCDALGLFGAGVEFSLPKVLRVLLILVGGVLVVQF